MDIDYMFHGLVGFSMMIETVGDDMDTRRFDKKSILLWVFTLSLLLLIAISDRLRAQGTTEDIETRISRVESEVWNGGDVELLDTIYDSNCVLHVGSSMNMQGTQGLKRMIMMFRGLFPDRTFQIDEIFTTGNRVTERYTWRGTHSGTGKTVTVSGCVVYFVKEGIIVEAWNYEDMFGLYQQLGLVSPQSLFGQSGG